MRKETGGKDGGQEGAEQWGEPTLAVASVDTVTTWPVAGATTECTTGPECSRVVSSLQPAVDHTWRR